MKTKQILAASSLILALGMAQSASATVQFAFDPNGTGSTAQVFDAIDQSPGSAIAIGGVTAINNFISGVGSTEFTLAYQANLSALSLNGLNGFSNGAGGLFFNFTMQFQEVVTSAVAANNSATFNFAPGGTNLFQMYASNALANNLTGAGFGTVGSPILTAHVVSTPSSNYVNSGSNSSRLDNFGSNNWVGTGTRIGSGSSDIRLVIDSVNSLYFPDLDLASQIALSFFNTSQVTPFNQADPSRSFNWLAGGAYASNVGAINGLNGPDFLFQADGNQSIDTIPEPETLLLLGLGLAGFYLTRKNVKA